MGNLVPRAFSLNYRENPGHEVVVLWVSIEQVIHRHSFDVKT